MSTAMGTPFFHELKKQASFFFREKIKTARLALTDVTPAELLTEEATNGNPWAPDARTMAFISRAAFEIDDYWRITEILHKRLSKFDRKYWREPYQALVILEHLMTHGPESTAEEFQCDREVIEEMGSFQYIDERGFNWGLTVRKKSERVLKLLEKGPLLKEERDRARKVARGIEGFGSFSHRWVSDKSGIEKGSDLFRKWNSHYEADADEEQDDEVEDINKNKIQEKGISQTPDRRLQVDAVSAVGLLSCVLKLCDVVVIVLLVNVEFRVRFKAWETSSSNSVFAYSRDIMKGEKQPAVCEIMSHIPLTERV
ncbi:clathrin interactor EPSIN 1-like [Asparagus officinalis]|uniref:clathrin interactor EPSIN 1-like n=1 Tax=Asparagus officinalis TaxID=4686 RepID=UPI00098E3342|nr:clathrin interactor EPSIN 1-like [Asparagus officinalis]